MKFFGVATAIIGALVTIASSAPTAFMTDDPDTTKFYITAPLEKNVYSAGGVITAEWINGVPGPFKLELLKGNIAASMQDTRIAFRNTEGSTGSYKWQVPSDIPAGTYAFHFIFNGGESYSPQFKITSASNSQQQQQQHAETAPPRGTSDNTVTNGSAVRPNTGAATGVTTGAATDAATNGPNSSISNETTNTRSQLPSQKASDKAPATAADSSTVLGTSNDVPTQQTTNQKQSVQHQASPDVETGRS